MNEKLVELTNFYNSNDSTVVLLPNLNGVKFYSKNRATAEWIFIRFKWDFVWKNTENILWISWGVILYEKYFLSFAKLGYFIFWIKFQEVSKKFSEYVFVFRIYNEFRLKLEFGKQIYRDCGFIYLWDIIILPQK